MGKTRDALFGRTFKASKFKSLVNLAISRLAVLKHQRQARFKHARSDVLQFLQLGSHERALLRAEHVVKEQNLLDVYDRIERYLNLLAERVHLVEEERECPEELKEAASSLLYASSRCGEFPELQEIRTVLTTRFGKEFAARAIELRNNCAVPPQMIQKLSTRMPSLETRMKALKEIASENNIVLELDQVSSDTVEGPSNVKNENQPGPDRWEKEKIHKDDQFSDSLEARKKYKDVADAAQAAFESAANAAAAARAAVELSRSESHDPPPNDHNTPDDGSGNFREIMSQVVEKEILPPSDDHTTPDDGRGDSREIMPEEIEKKFVEENTGEEFNKSDSEEEAVKEAAVLVVAEVDARPDKEEPFFDESENEGDNEHEGKKSFKQISSKSHDGEVAGFDPKDSTLEADAGPKKQSSLSRNFEKLKKPFSVRTKRVWGFSVRTSA